MTELAIAATHSELAIGGDQDWFTDKQLAALKQHMGVADAPNADLAVFLHQCKRTGLDPFSKQIYMLARRTKDGNQWVTKWDILAGINGVRVLGDRIAAKRGDTIEHDDTLWSGDDGAWRDVWTSETPPVAAKYTIIKNGRRNVATAHYREYVQRKSDGNPNAMWNKMPCNQLAKCAEMQAWNKVYPNDFAGLNLEGAYLPTESAMREDPAPRYVTTTERAKQIVVVDEAAPDDPDEGAPPPEAAASALNRRKWVNRMFALLNEGNATDRDDQLVVIAELAGRADDPPEHRDGITDDELRTVVKKLDELSKSGVLVAQVGDILDAHAIDLAQQAAPEPGAQETQP